MSQRCEQQQAAPPLRPAPASFGTGNGVRDVFAETSSSELDRIFHALPIGLAALDAGLRVLRANAAFAAFGRMHDWERVGVGRPLEQLLPDFAAPLLPACRAVLAGTDDGTSLELTEETEEERPQVWEVRLSRLGAGGRDTAGLAVVVLDVTNQKEEAGRRRLALRELDHRLRNVLAVAQSADRRRQRRVGVAKRAKIPVNTSGAGQFDHAARRNRNADALQDTGALAKCFPLGRTKPSWHVIRVG